MTESHGDAVVITEEGTAVKETQPLDPITKVEAQEHAVAVLRSGQPDAMVIEHAS
jgi:hypothetical protein